MATLFAGTAHLNTNDKVTQPANAGWPYGYDAGWGVSKRDRLKKKGAPGALVR